MYPLVFFDALRVKIRDEGTVRNDEAATKLIWLALRYIEKTGKCHRSHGVPRKPNSPFFLPIVLPHTRDEVLKLTTDFRRTRFLTPFEPKDSSRFRRLMSFAPTSNQPRLLIEVQFSANLDCQPVVDPNSLIVHAGIQLHFPFISSRLCLSSLNFSPMSTTCVLSI